MLLAWQARSVAEKRRIAAFLLLGAVMLPAFCWSWINASASETREETLQVKARFERALPLAQEVAEYQQEQDRSMPDLSALATAQQIARDMHLEDKLSSIRPSRAVSDRDGVQLYLENLNLAELLQLFRNLQQQAGFEVVSANLNRRLDHERRMDVNLVLVR